MSKLYRYAAAGLLVVATVGNARATVNVSFASSLPSTTQQEFISNTTGQYLSTLTPSPFFKDTYSLTITGKNPAYQPPTTQPPVTQPPPQVLNWQQVIDTFVAKSTTNFEYGWGFGVETGYQISMNSISNYILNCSSPTYFAASTSSWSPSTCGIALMAAETNIYSLQFSTPTIMPVVP